jgi:phosphoribosylformimino-5-aminoimidazole carboxamide ribotide isomerase
VELYPAIDVLGGNAVRLVRGDFEAKKVYDERPLDAARRWVADGARRLHVVDLDGARAGAPVNLEHLREIASEVGVPVQYGGGLRSVRAVGEALGAGADRAIVGTVALTQPRLLAEILDEHGPQSVVVSVDVRGGRPASAGWLESTETSTEAALDELQEAGVEWFVYTDVDRDGMLEGPDVERVVDVASRISGRMIYSGGIGALADLEALARARAASLSGVIVGKALYEERFTIAQAQEVLARDNG